MNTAIDLRQHILDTAKPLMLRKGFTAVGLTELLAAAGIPKGSSTTTSRPKKRSAKRC